MDKITSFACREGIAEVKTKAGWLRGFVQNDVYHFHGIEYAKAERFKAPHPVEPWEGFKTAQDYGYVCPAFDVIVPKGDIMNPHFGWTANEDCLNLNVFTKKLGTKAKQPVMVWFHGGGFTAGNATDLLAYNGHTQALYGDVVSVTVNHRLNVFGFLDLSAYSDDYKDSGNVGEMDLVAALQWVHDNIEQFGGDPENVTIFGHSGGGNKVTTLMQMPAADGLYQKAIVQSGIINMVDRNGNDMHMTKEAALGYADQLVKTAGGFQQLLDMDTDELMKCCWKTYPSHQFWMPVPGAGGFPGAFDVIGMREESKNIPVLVGSALCEFTGYQCGAIKSEMTEDEKLKCLTDVYGDRAPVVKEKFEKAYPNVNSYYAVGLDYNSFRPGVLAYCDQRAELNGAPTYNYMLTYETAYNGGTMSFHGTELPFIFHAGEFVGAMQNGEQTWITQDEIFDAWVNFARTGNPNHAKLPTAWKPYTSEAHNCLIFGAPTTCEIDHDKELLAYMNG